MKLPLRPSKTDSDDIKTGINPFFTISSISPFVQLTFIHFDSTGRSIISLNLTTPAAIITCEYWL